MDKFPEAFARFESEVDVDSFDSFHELIVAFRWWAGKRWKGTRMQRRALNAEVKRLASSYPRLGLSKTGERRGSDFYASKKQRKAIYWRREFVTVKGRPQNRYRDLNTGRFIRKPK